MSLGRNTLSGTATSLLVLALGLAVSVVLSRSLGPHDRGVYFLLVGTNAMVGGIVAPGIGDALAAFSARARHSFAELHAVALLAAFAVGSVGLGLGSLAFTLLRGNVFRGVTYPELLVALLVVPATVYQRYWAALLIGSERIVLLNLTTAALNVGAATATIVAVGALDLGIPGFLGAWTASTVVGALAAGAVAHRAGARAIRPSGSAVRDVVSFGARSNPAAMAQQASVRFDAYAVNGIVGTSALGVYSLSTTLAEATWIPVRALEAAALARTARMTRLEAAELTARLVRLSTLLVAACAVPAAAVSPWLLPAVYGSPFRGAVVPFVLLLPGAACFSAMLLLHGYILVQMQRPGLLSIVTLTQLAIRVPLFIGLIELWGIRGAALASTVGYALVSAAATLVFLWHSGLPASRLLPTVADVRDSARELRRLHV